MRVNIFIQALLPSRNYINGVEFRVITETYNFCEQKGLEFCLAHGIYACLAIIGVDMRPLKPGKRQ